jgi:hypothetical protein
MPLSGDRGAGRGEQPVAASLRPRTQELTNPFQPAQARRKRLKLLTWGDSGVGKTTLALRFPSPVVIDLEGGCDLYGDRFEFGVLRTTSCEEVDRAVDWLAANDHGRTLVLDPVSILWDAIQEKWSQVFLQRSRGSKGHRHDFFELGPKEWQTIKSDWKGFVRKLIALDMHVVVTARAKPQYAEAGFMRQIGMTFDGEKSLPYLFDVVLRQYRDDAGRFLAEVVKDRTGKLPTEPFEPKIEIFQRLLGSAEEAEPAGPSSREE